MARLRMFSFSIPPFLPPKPSPLKGSTNLLAERESLSISPLEQLTKKEEGEGKAAATAAAATTAVSSKLLLEEEQLRVLLYLCSQ